MTTTKDDNSKTRATIPAMPAVRGPGNAKALPMTRGEWLQLFTAALPQSNSTDPSRCIKLAAEIADRAALELESRVFRGDPRPAPMGPPLGEPRRAAPARVFEPSLPPMIHRPGPKESTW